MTNDNAAIVKDMMAKASNLLEERWRRADQERKRLNAEIKGLVNPVEDLLKKEYGLDWVMIRADKNHISVDVVPLHGDDDRIKALLDSIQSFELVSILFHHDNAHRLTNEVVTLVHQDNGKWMVRRGDNRPSDDWWVLAINQPTLYQAFLRFRKGIEARTTKEQE